MEVRDAVAVDETQGGVVEVELHHRRGMGQEGLDAGAVVAVAQDVAQVGARLLRILPDAGALREFGHRGVKVAAVNGSLITGGVSSSTSLPAVSIAPSRADSE